LKAGERVLILGGSSAVGSLAVQLAKNAGLWVATTTSTRALEYTAQWGADQIINYNDAKWVEDGGLQGIDAVIDTVGEAGSFTTAKRILKSDGAYVTIVDPSEVGFDSTAHPPLKFASHYRLHNSPEVQSELVGQIAQGKLKVVIDETFPFTKEGVVAILKKAEAKKSLGKNILKVDPSL
jgi:NADPH:quinone reductase-like Zn-dependent oxidoreductase